MKQGQAIFTNQHQAMIKGVEMMVKVPACSSEVTHGVRRVSQARVNSCVGLLGIARASRHLLLLPPLQAGCFGVQIPLCGFKDTERILGLKIV